MYSAHVRDGLRVPSQQSCLQRHLKDFLPVLCSRTLLRCFVAENLNRGVTMLALCPGNKTMALYNLATPRSGFSSLRPHDSGFFKGGVCNVDKRRDAVRAPPLYVCMRRMRLILGHANLNLLAHLHHQVSNQGFAQAELSTSPCHSLHACARVHTHTHTHTHNIKYET